MRSLLTLAVVLGLAVAGAAAQPADCPTLPPSGPMQPVVIDQGGRPGGQGKGADGHGERSGGRGERSEGTGQIIIGVPAQAPRTDCGEPSLPADVLRGAPGDLLRGTPPAQGAR